MVRNADPSTARGQACPSRSPSEPLPQDSDPAPSRLKLPTQDSQCTSHENRNWAWGRSVDRWRGHPHFHLPARLPGAHRLALALCPPPPPPRAERDWQQSAVCPGRGRPSWASPGGRKAGGPGGDKAPVREGNGSEGTEWSDLPSWLRARRGLKPSWCASRGPRRPSPRAGAAGLAQDSWCTSRAARAAAAWGQARVNLAGCRPGPCYLCTMSLISLTEPSSLLKSCVAAGPPPAAAGQICSSRRLLSSLLMASRKANLFLICWMEST